MYLVFLDENPASPGNYFYQNTAHTVKLFDGKLDYGSHDEASVSLQLESNLNVLDIDLPKVHYSSTCPFTLGDANCTRQGSLVSQSTYVTSLMATTTMRITGTDFSATDYWTHGIAIFQTGDLIGVVRAIANCSRISSGVS